MEQEYICLSNKPFQRESYDFIPKDINYAWDSQLVPNIKPIGMWFSKKENEGYLSRWHQYIVTEEQGLITHCCDEEGKTTVISVTLKNALKVSPEEIQNEIEIALSENGEEAPRKKLLDLVRAKIGRPDIEYLICDMDGANSSQGGFSYLYPFVTSNEDRQRNQTQNEHLRELNAFDAFCKAYRMVTGCTGMDKYDFYEMYANHPSFEKYDKTKALETLDFVEKVTTKSDYSDEEYLDFFMKYGQLIRKELLESQVVRILRR